MYEEYDTDDDYDNNGRIYGEVEYGEVTYGRDYDGNFYYDHNDDDESLDAFCFCNNSIGCRSKIKHNGVICGNSLMEPRAIVRGNKVVEILKVKVSDEKSPVVEKSKDRCFREEDKFLILVKRLPDSVKYNIYMLALGLFGKNDLKNRSIKTFSILWNNPITIKLHKTDKEILNALLRQKYNNYNILHFSTETSYNRDYFKETGTTRYCNCKQCDWCLFNTTVRAHYLYVTYTQGCEEYNDKYYIAHWFCYITNRNYSITYMVENKNIPCKIKI